MTKVAERRAAMRALLAEGKTIIAPGAYDPMSAMLIERARFPVVYIGSYATAAARLGFPDVGLVTMEEMAAHAKAVADAVSIPVLADAENGWVNAANIWRTVRSFEAAGVCGIHIEDQEFGKHAAVTPVLAPLDRAVQKIRAACEARQDPNFLIIARTDAAWASGDVEGAVRRMNAFREAGADLVMAAGLDPRVLAEIRPRIDGKVVITDTPGRTVAEEEAAGADVVLYYGFALYAAFAGVKRALETFKQTRSADAVPNLREEIAEFEAFLGYGAFAERAKKYGLA